MPEGVDKLIGEHLSWNGYFDIPTLVGISVFFVVLVTVLTFIECRGAKFWKLPVLIILRLVAIAVVIAMLAEPSRVQVRERLEKKSLGFYLDASDSMKVKDKHNELRTWELIDKADEAWTRWSEIDGCLIMLEHTHDELERFQRLKLGATKKSELLACLTGAIRAGKLAEKNMRAWIGHADKQSLNSLYLHQRYLKNRLLPQLERMSHELESAAPFVGMSNDKFDDHLFQIKTMGRELDMTRDKLVGKVKAVSKRRSRLDLGFEMLKRSKGELGERLDDIHVQTHAFAQDVIPLGAKLDVQLPKTPKSWSQKSDLDETMRQLGRDHVARPMAAAFLFSDGAHHSADKAQDKASELGQRLYIFPTGQARKVRDVWLHHVSCPKNVLLDDLVLVEGFVSASDCLGESLKVDLMHGGRVVDSRRFKVKYGDFIERFEFRPKADKLGDREYQVRCTVLKREEDKENNRVKIKTHVMSEKLKVLLVDEYPRWEYQYLRNLLKRDESIELTHLLLSNGRGIPPGLDYWSRHQIVVLGDLSKRHLSAKRLKELETYIKEHGGKVVCIAGEDMPGDYRGTSLADWIPVELKRQVKVDPRGYRLKLSAEGESFPVFDLDRDLKTQAIFADLSKRQPLYHLSPYSVAKASAHVMIEAVNKSGQATSLFSWHRFGEGKVVYLASPFTYFLRYQKGDVHHHRFWVQLLRWLNADALSKGSKCVKIKVDRKILTSGESLNVHGDLQYLDGRKLRGAKVAASAYLDGKAVARLDLREIGGGKYTGKFDKLPAGKVRIRLEGKSVEELLRSEKEVDEVSESVIVQAARNEEMRNLRLNLDYLERMAQYTGGMVCPPTAMPAIMEWLDLEPRREKLEKVHPLWNEWPYLWLFIGVLAVEWGVRKFTGMV